MKNLKSEPDIRSIACASVGITGKTRIFDLPSAYLTEFEASVCTYSGRIAIAVGADDRLQPIPSVRSIVPLRSGLTDTYQVRNNVLKSCRVYNLYADSSVTFTRLLTCIHLN